MKVTCKRLTALLLVLCLLCAQVSAVNVTARTTGSSGELEYTYVVQDWVEDGDGEGDWVFYLGDPEFWQSSFRGSIYHEVQMAFRRGDTGEALTDPNCFHVTGGAQLVENQHPACVGKGYFNLIMTDFNGGTITYDDGTNTFSMDFEAFLPDVAAYSTPEAREDTYLHEFHMTENCQSFYVVNDNSEMWQMENVWALDSWLTPYITIEPAGKTAFKVTLDPAYSWEYLHLCVSGTYLDGTSNPCSTSVRMEVISDLPKTEFLFLDSHPEFDASGNMTETWTPRTNEPWQNRYTGIPGNTAFVALRDGAGQPLADVSALTLTGGLTLTPIEGWQDAGYYRMEITSFDSGTISGRAGDVPMQVQVRMPDFHAFSAPVPDEAHFLKDFTMTQEIDTFYLCNTRPGDVEFTEVGNYSEEFGAYLTIEAAGTQVWKVTVDHSAPTRLHANFYAKGHGVNGGGQFEIGFGFELRSTYPRVTYAHVESIHEDENGELQFELSREPYWIDSLSAVPGGQLPVALRGGDGELITDPAGITVTGDVTVTPTEQPGFYWVEVTGFGTGSISDGTDAIPLEVSGFMPEFSAFTEQVADEAHFLSSFTVTEENNVFYLGSANSSPQPLTLSNVHFIGEQNQPYVTVEDLGNQFWKVTVDPDIPDGIMVFFQADAQAQNRPDGGQVQRGIQIFNGVPHLEIISANNRYEDDGTVVWQEADYDRYNNVYSLPPSFVRQPVRLMFQGAAVNPGEVTAEGSVSLERAEAEYAAAGYGYLRVTAPEGGGLLWEHEGKTYRLPVNAYQPGLYTYSAPDGFQDQMLAEFAPAEIGEEGAAFYVVNLYPQTDTYTELTVTTAEGQVPDYLTIESDGDQVWKVTVSPDAPAGDQHLEFQGTGTCLDPNQVSHSLENSFPFLVKVPAGKQVFTDVPETAYYAKPVQWAVDMGVTSGTSETTFAPDAPCTRGQIVAFLWRAAGKPEPQSSENPFTDVKESSYFYKAVLWAVEKGITSGTSKTTFSPGAPCTRAQVVAFLWRAAGKPEPKSSENPFTDVQSGYYYKAVLWAVENKITSGTSKTAFSPGATCTRGQIVTFLYRALA